MQANPESFISRDGGGVTKQLLQNTLSRTWKTESFTIFGFFNGFRNTCLIPI